MNSNNTLAALLAKIHQELKIPKAQLLSQTKQIIELALLKRSENNQSLEPELTMEELTQAVRELSVN